MAVQPVEQTVAPAPASKVVSLNQFGHEEQVKSTDVGTTTVAKAHKNLYPASNPVKVPVEEQNALVQQYLAQVQANYAALSPEERAQVTAQVRNALSQVLSSVSVLAKAPSEPSEPSTSTVQEPSKNGDKDQPSYDPFNQSILWLFTIFSEDQMTQNDEMLAGWVSQQDAQNQILSDVAASEEKTAHTSVTSHHATGFLSWFAPIAIACVLSAFAGPLAPLVIAAGIGVAIADNVDPDAFAKSKATSWLTQPGADQAKLDQLNWTNTMLSTLAQKANQSIQTGSQINVVNTSSQNTQLGQQAAQAIQEYGQIMATPINR